MKSGQAETRDDVLSLVRHSWVGIVATAVLCGGLVAWSAATEVSGAIIASGTLMVQSNAKQVQHPEGGVVAKLLVQNEDHVEADQLLVVLDQTALSAALEVSESQLRRLLAQEARLLKEVEQQAHVEIPQFAQTLFNEAELRSAIILEQQILTARNAARVGRINQLEEQIVQLELQREGLTLQQEALTDQITIVEEELNDFGELFANQLIQASRGTALRKELAATKGELGQTVAAIAESHAGSAETALQIAQINQDYLTNALSELADTRRAIDETVQRRIADMDRLAKSEIRAPQSGIIHELSLHTVGGVVPVGETLMLVVPTDDPLLVSTRVQTVDIDKVHVGQEVVIRFPGLNPRTTPEILGQVERIAPDATSDPATGAPFYSIRISIPDSELAKLPPEVDLVPGMPAESYLQLANRTVLAYLLQPIVDQFRMALREE